MYILIRYVYFCSMAMDRSLTSGSVLWMQKGKIRSVLVQGAADLDQYSIPNVLRTMLLLYFFINPGCAHIESPSLNTLDFHVKHCQLFFCENK